MSDFESRPEDRVNIGTRTNDEEMMGLLRALDRHQAGPKNHKGYVNAVEYSHTLEKLLIMERENSAALRGELESAERERDADKAMISYQGECIINAELAMREAELALRDAAASEPGAYQIHSDLEGWRECTPERYAEVSSRPLVDGKHSGGWLVRKLYTDAPPAVLPPEMINADAPCHYSSEETFAWVAGANWMRQQCLELGAQQQKVVESPDMLSEEFHDYGGNFQYSTYQKTLHAELDAANVKWEVKP